VIEIIALLLAARLQGPPPPPPPPQMRARDLAPEKKGTAVIKGQVTTIDGRPLRRAQIMLRGSELPNGRTTSTGLEGEYEIREIPAGRYTVGAMRGGYLPSQYGQKRHGEQGIPIDIGNGAVLDRINISLERAGVISGRVLDEAGEPVAGAAIYTMQSQFFRGRRQLVPANMGGGMRTDDTGMYRISPLAPGEYLVLALFRETWVADDKDKQTLGYAPSYYPGTTSLAAAQRIKVVAGQEASAIDFSLVPGRAATISGTVVSADGSPLATANVAVTQEINGPAGSSMSMVANARAAADGTFKIRDVSPGQYILRASGPASERGSETASLNLTVTGADIDGLILGADTGGLITGRVVTDTGTPLSGSPPTVTVSSATFDRPSVTVLPAEDGKVAPGGRFVRRAASGPAFIRIGGLPSGWALKSVTIGGQDITTAPVDIRAGQTLADVTIVISERLPPITGQVTDANGRPSDGPVLLFPADEARWHEAADTVRSARTDQSGKFRFDRVRPGDYLIVAIDQLATWQQYDPEFLAPLRDRSMKITVAEEPAAVDLKVVVR
jgi:hypothetical protein